MKFTPFKSTSGRLKDPLRSWMNKANSKSSYCTRLIVSNAILWFVNITVLLLVSSVVIGYFTLGAWVCGSFLDSTIGEYASDREMIPVLGFGLFFIINALAFLGKELIDEIKRTCDSGWEHAQRNKNDNSE